MRFFSGSGYSLRRGRMVLAMIVMVVIQLTCVPEAVSQIKGPFLKTGPAFQFLNNDLEAINRVRLRFHIGIAPTIETGIKSYLKPEVTFAMKGGRVDYDDDFGNFDGNILYRLNYFDFPLVFGYRLRDKLAVEAGGYAAVNVGGNFDFDGAFFNGFGTFDSEAIETWDYGWIIGLAFDTKRSIITCRYYNGIPEITSDPEAQPFLGNSQIRSIQISFQRKNGFL